MRAFELADLIDLEIQLQKDRDVDRGSLRERDHRIGQAIDASAIDREAQVVGWIDQIRRSHKEETIGQKTARFLEMLGFGLVLLGFALGAASVASWLAYDTHRPVNVVFFWGTLVGLQIALLCGWLIAALPTSWLRWIPGGASCQRLLQCVGRLPPALLAWLVARCSGDLRTTIAALRGKTKRLDWLYGKLRFWTLVRLTQIFAVAYNVGAIVLFVGLSYGNDPTFGWKSTRMRPVAMHRVVETIAWPWSGWTDAVPTLEDVRRTQYTSLDDRFVGRSNHDRTDDVQTWASWWPFLFGSLVVYGLLPRIATLALTHWQVRRALRQSPANHHELDKLLNRLQRTPVATRAVVADCDDLPSTEAPSAAIDDRLDLALDGQSVPVLQWAGVELSPDEVRTLLDYGFGIPVSTIETLGQSAPSHDADVVASLADQDRPAAIVWIVEAWEPPVAEYLDFLAQLRSAIGQGITIVVLLYQRDRGGTTTPPTPEDLTIWRRRLAETGDAWLEVHPLIASDSASEDAS